MDHQVIIIGAGISGLTAAIELEKNGYKPVIYESTDRVGGRIKTDKKEGYLLDHGFQVLLTAYPEAQKYLDYETLDLRKFNPGAKIYDGKIRYNIGDPLRQPSAIFTMIISPVGSLGDKIKIWSLSRLLKKKAITEIFESQEMSTLDYLREFGFSENMITKFFRPFFAGIFLEEELATSSRMFEFVFKMFSEGHAAIPAQGMQAIPDQLAGQLKKTTIYFNKKVTTIQGKTVTFQEGEQITAEKIILASDPHAILPGLQREDQEYRSVYNLYFSTPFSAIDRPAIALVPGKDRLINNFCYLTDLSEDYAPSGKALLSISVVKDTDLKGEDLIDRIQKEIFSITGTPVSDMEHLHTFHIRQALPVLSDLKMDISPTATRIVDDVFLAGDYLLNGSLNAAMVSGRRAAEAVMDKI